MTRPPAGWRFWIAAIATGAVLVALYVADGTESGPVVDVLSRSPAIEAFETRSNGLELTTEGVVVRLLPDDKDGSRHQRFVIDVGDGHTVLVSHNIDLAPRVPVTEGARVVVRGEYEWNELGGVVHWTHHDPEGRRKGGWIQLGGQRYR